MNREEIKIKEEECNYELEILRNKIESLENELDNLENLKQYPCVKIMDYVYGNGQQIVLFTAPNTGTNINGIGWPQGHNSDGWDEDSAKLFTGIIEYKDGISVKGQRYYE